MNLITTDVCNRNCPYCFAEFKLTRRKQESFISMESFLAYLDFLDRSSDKRLKLLGGEPTLHPEFTALVDKGLERGFEVTIFTNGMWKPAVVDYFKKGIPPQVFFVFNINEPGVRAEDEARRQAAGLELVGNHAKAGFNLFHKDFDLLFLGDIIDRYDLQRVIRLGLACPITNTPTQYIGDEDLKAVGTRLVEQLRRLEERGILGSLDCGFPLCMFDETELGKLQLCSTGFNSICDPIIDVGADLTAWPCFPLSNMFNVKLTDFESKEPLLAYYREKFNPFRSFGSREECLGCKYLDRSQCSGGCLARGIVEFAKNDAAFFEKLESGREPVTDGSCYPPSVF